MPDQHLTQEQQKQLLLLGNSKWKELRLAVKTHFTDGSHMPEPYAFLLALSCEQWQTLESKLEALRHAHKDKLQELRKQSKAQAARERKRNYMRGYMKKYRQKEPTGDGQDSGQVGD